MDSMYFDPIYPNFAVQLLADHSLPHTSSIVMPSSSIHVCMCIGLYTETLKKNPMMVTALKKLNSLSPIGRNQLPIDLQLGEGPHNPLEFS